MFDKKCVYNICVSLWLLTGLSQSAFAASEMLTWSDCLREAAKNHPDLVAAQEDINQSKYDKVLAASQILPHITADGKASVDRSKSSGSSKTFSYGINGDQLLFDGFNTINQINAAKENIQLSRESFHFVSSQVRWRLRTAFIYLLKAQRLTDLTKEIHRIRDQNLQLIRLRYQSGMEHRGALLTAQANVAQAELEMREAQRALELAQYGLNREMGRPDFTPLVAAGDLTLSVTNNTYPDFKELARNHPNYLKAVAQKNAAGYEIKSSRADFLPTITVSGDVGRSGSSWGPDETGSGAIVNVSLPIFQGGAHAAQLAKSKSIYRQLQANEVSSLDEILYSLREVWNALMDAKESIDVQQKFMQAAEERSKIAEAQYSVGSITFDNWTIIQDDWVRQKKSLLNAQADALLAQADWMQAQGETLEYENQN